MSRLFFSIDQRPVARATPHSPFLRSGNLPVFSRFPSFRALLSFPFRPLRHTTPQLSLASVCFLLCLLRCLRLPFFFRSPFYGGLPAFLPSSAGLPWNMNGNRHYKPFCPSSRRLPCALPKHFHISHALGFAYPPRYASPPPRRLFVRAVRLPFSPPVSNLLRPLQTQFFRGHSGFSVVFCCDVSRFLVKSTVFPIPLRYFFSPLFFFARLGICDFFFSSLCGEQNFLVPANLFPYKRPFAQTIFFPLDAFPFLLLTVSSSYED